MAEIAKQKIYRNRTMCKRSIPKGRNWIIGFQGILLCPFSLCNLILVMQHHDFYISSYCDFLPAFNMKQIIDQWDIKPVCPIFQKGRHRGVGRYILKAVTKVWDLVDYTTHRYFYVFSCVYFHAYFRLRLTPTNTHIHPLTHTHIKNVETANTIF